jgi:ornithine carbamoyltransferase
MVSKELTRTRFSFDAAMRQLGGSTILANAADMQLGRGEPWTTPPECSAAWSTR